MKEICEERRERREGRGGSGGGAGGTGRLREVWGKKEMRR